MSKIQIKKSGFDFLNIRISNLFRISDFGFSIFEREAGFTLIEALVAIALIAGGLVSALSLTTKSVFDASRIKNDLIAVNLAQEGIEMMRLIRENNVLCDFLNGPRIPQDVCLWDKEPRAAACTVGGPKLSSNNGYTVDTNAVTIPMGCTDPAVGVARTLMMPQLGGSCAAPSSILRIDSNGIYNYSSGTPTPFRRCVYVCNPTNMGGPLGLDGKAVCSVAPDGDIPSASQMDVVSVVAWTENGILKSTRLEQRLYNWR